MRVFDRLFNRSKRLGDKSTLPWQELTDLNQLDEIRECSKTKPQLIFKHSTRCGISRTVKREFEANFLFNDEEVNLFYLDLLSYRDISNEIAFRFGIHHESPQLLIIKNGEVVKHASHGKIIDSIIF